MICRKDVSTLPRISEESRGFSPKFWVFDGVKKLVKYNTNLCPDGDLMEMLSADIMDVLGINHVKVELGYDSDDERVKQLNVTDQNCCLVHTYMHDVGDVSFEIIKKIPKSCSSTVEKQIRNNLSGVRNILRNLSGNTDDVADIMFRDYLRILVGDCFVDNEDRAMKNVGIIYNEKSKRYRLAPSFDNALAFNSYNLSSDDSYVCIGNQYHCAEDVLSYIIKVYPDVVEDILDNVCTLDQNKDNLLNKYSLEFEKDKLDFIDGYLTKILTKVRKT